MIGEVAEIDERKDIKGKPMFVVHIITDGVSERYIVPKPHMIDGIEIGDTVDFCWVESQNGNRIITRIERSAGWDERAIRLSSLYIASEMFFETRMSAKRKVEELIDAARRIEGFILGR